MITQNTKTWAFTLFAASILTVMPELSFADATDPLSEPLCAIANWFTGDTGTAIATVAIIFLGIAAFFGKVTWGLALMFGVGVFAIFGAADIVSAIDGKGGDGACK